jgi:hypothetical protein
MIPPTDDRGGRGAGPQRNIIKFTRDKRPVSSHNPPGFRMQRHGRLVSRDSSLAAGAHFKNPAESAKSINQMIAI